MLAAPSKIDVNIIPVEVLENIFKFLSAEDRLNMSLVNSLFQQIAQKDYLWKELVIRYFPYLQDLQEIVSNEKTKPVQSLFIKTYTTFAEDVVCRELDKSLLHAAIIGNINKINQRNDLSENIKECCLITLVANNHFDLLKDCYLWHEYDVDEQTFFIKEGCALAARHGNHRVVKSLLTESGIDMLQGALASMKLASKNGYKRVVEEILNAYKKFDEDDLEDLRIAGIKAADHNHYEIALLILEKIQKQDSEFGEEIVDNLCAQFEKAAADGNLKTVQTLLELGFGNKIVFAAGMFKINILAWTLSKALEVKKFDIAEAILEKYKKNPGEIGLTDITILRVIACVLADSGNSKLFHKFLEKMVEEYGTNSLEEYEFDLSQLLILAAEQGNTDKVKRVLSVGVGMTVGIYTRDNSGTLATALTKAIDNDNDAVVDVLIEHAKQLPSTSGCLLEKIDEILSSRRTSICRRVVRDQPQSFDMDEPIWASDPLAAIQAMLFSYPNVLVPQVSSDEDDETENEVVEQSDVGSPSSQTSSDEVASSVSQTSSDEDDAVIEESDVEPEHKRPAL